MRVIVLASGSIAVPTLRWLLGSSHDILALVTQPDRPAGRGRRTTTSALMSCARSAGLECIQVEDVNEHNVVDRLLGFRADLGITISFGQMIGSSLLDGIPFGCINIHPSLLPKYRGAAPVNWAVIRGEVKTGVTVFRLVRRMDAGPILTRRETIIKPDETAGELQERLARIAPDALGAALSMFESGSVPSGEPQDESQATYAPKLTKQTGYGVLNYPAAEVIRWVNGLFPWPAVHLQYVPRDGRKQVQVRLCRATALSDSSDLPVGATGKILEGGAVACSGGAFRILELQPAGGRIMSWQDFVNGRRVEIGDRFEPLQG